MPSLAVPGSSAGHKACRNEQSLLVHVVVQELVEEALVRVVQSNVVLGHDIVSQ